MSAGMSIDEYFGLLSKNFEIANRVASEARAKGYDPETRVEIIAAPDLAARVEGIIGMEGLADVIRREAEIRQSRQELAFGIVERICKDKDVERITGADSIIKRMDLSVKVGLAILTEGILVAPTEGFQGVELHRNPDGSDYVAALYAGPIRGAGGTSAALSVALLDLARKLLGVGAYKAQKSEIERCLEEIQIYNARAARLQYMPSESDTRVILESCPVCIDGLPTEEFEVGTHRDITRLDQSGKEVAITNRIRGGVCLVVCEGIAQKAKNVLKYTKIAGLDWGWLNNIIKVDKGQGKRDAGESDAVFLHEQVAGRPIFAYPDYPGAFRLRYGRSRYTGIAAKGLNPATMVMLRFIAVGTQLKIERPGKGCIAMPVDSIEGPFVKTKGGDAFRIDTVEDAMININNIAKILSVGDMLITVGDFKKSNTKLIPTSYVEEYWEAQLRAAGYEGDLPALNSFESAFRISERYSVPMHPRYIYEYQDVKDYQLRMLSEAIRGASLDMDRKGEGVFNVEKLRFTKGVEGIRDILELICIPHSDGGSSIEVRGDHAQSLISTFGFVRDGRVDLSKNVDMSGEDTITMINSVSPFVVMRRSYRIGGRMGRPEKAKERLMKPAPNLLFPIGEYGGKERNISKAYALEAKKFRSGDIEIDIAKFRCSIGGEYVTSPFCNTHVCGAVIERYCKRCGIKSDSKVCSNCKSKTIANEIRRVSIIDIVDSAMKNLDMHTMPKSVKGVVGLVSKDRVAEPVEKGILRSLHDVYIFKDGTCRFDATDAPITHFYPEEIGTDVERLRELGYTHDIYGKALERKDQLLELKHQDVIMNKRAGDYLLRVSKFVDDLLSKHYRMDRFYNAEGQKDMVGQYVITLSPHTSAGVLGRIIGFTGAAIGLCHPYLVSARRRNCDGDEDTTMLLLDGLLNFSRSYLPTTVGGTMDAPLILTVNVRPEEVDDEVHEMDIVSSYPVEFYEATYRSASASEVQIESVKSRLGSDGAFADIMFSHSSSNGIAERSPNRSAYTLMKTMSEKVDEQFRLMDILSSIDKKDTAKRLITSHFIPDMMGNLHSFSKQRFRCVSCNAKYRRVPLIGKCEKCGGKILLTISKGSIEKYLEMSIALVNKYKLDPYIEQRVLLLKREIDTVFGADYNVTKQFSLAKFI